MRPQPARSSLVPRWALSVLTVTAMAASAPVGSAQCHAETIKADDAGAGVSFAQALDRSGKLLVVGEYLYDGAFNETGRAVVMRELFTGFTEIEATLEAPDATDRDWFGVAVAADSDVIVVGASEADKAPNTLRGAAYVFRRVAGTWTFEAKLVGPGTVPAHTGGFGSAVDVQGDWIVVGAPGDTLSPSETGSAFVFHRESGAWLLHQKLLASLVLPTAQFGGSVAIDVHDSFQVTIVSGAKWGDALGPNSGAAFAFHFDGAAWTEQSVLLPWDGDNTQIWFGEDVALDGDVAVIGAPSYHGTALESGAAYVFRRAAGAWFPEAKLVNSDGAVFDGVGDSVDVEGELIVVGASGHDDPIPNGGALYAYRRQGGVWVEEAIAIAPTQPASAGLGLDCALEAGWMVGGEGGGLSPQPSGSVQVFGCIPDSSPWSDLGWPLPGTNGLPALLGQGSLLPGSTMSLALSNARPSTPAILCIGLSQLSAPFKGGVMVPNIAPPGTVLALATNGAGALALSSTWPGGVPANLSLYVQYWIVDPAGPVGFAASSGLRALTP